MKTFKVILAHYDKVIDMVVMSEIDVEAENEFEGMNDVSEFINKLPQIKGKPRNWRMIEVEHEYTD